MKGYYESCVTLFCVFKKVKVNQWFNTCYIMIDLNTLQHDLNTATSKLRELERVAYGGQASYVL